jgi:hypothetical protein
MEYLLRNTIPAIKCSSRQPRASFCWMEPLREAVFDRNLALVEEGNMVVKQSAYGGCRLSETRRTVSFDRRLKKHKEEDDL